MATNWSDFEPVDPVQKPASKKVDWSLFEPAAPAKADGQMASGFKRSFEEVPGLAAGVAAYGADVLGATETRDALIEYAKRKNDELAAAHANDAQSITDTWDGKTGWLDFLANSAGYVAGQALQSIATGGLGAVGARMLAKQGARELAEGVAAREIAAGASEKAAQAAVANALAQSASKTATRGAIAGAGAHNFGMELGSIYPDAVEEAKGADNLDGGDKFRILAAASLAAGVDTAGEAIMASRFLKGSKAGAPKVGPDGVISEGPGLLGRAAREIPAGMAREAGTEGIQTGLEQYGAGKTIGDAASIKDIVDSMGVGAVGGALGGAAGARKAREVEQAAHEPVAGILEAPDINSAIEATRRAIEEPNAREKRAALAEEILQLPQELQAEAKGLLATTGNWVPSPHVRAFAQSRLDEMLAPLRTIPVGEVIEDPAGTIPVPDTQELTSTEATSQILQPPDPAQIRAVGTRIPTGRATEIAPENIELGNQIPVGDVIEAGGDAPRPDGMPERRNTDGLALDFGTPQHFNAPHSVFQYVQTIAGLGTPASRAFVQDYKAGRITNDDVLNLLVPTRREPTANQRLEAAAAQAPKTEALKPGDLLTSDGKPYGVRVAAAVRAKKEGGTVVEVQGGWAVRPKESPGAQPDLPVPAAVAVRAPDGAGDQPGGSGGTVRPVADAGRTGQVYPGVPEAAASGIADRPAAGPGSERDQALTSNGFIAAPNGYKVRIARHQRGSNALDPTADVGAFTYEVRKGDNDPNPLTMVVSKDGKLVPAKSVLTDNKSNGTAWVPRSEESANTVSGLLAERAGTAVGSPERKAVDAKIAEAVAADQAGPTGGSAATNQALSDDLPTLKAAWSEAAARGDDAAMKRINDRIVQAKLAAPGNPAPGAGLQAPAVAPLTPAPSPATPAPTVAQKLKAKQEEKDAANGVVRWQRLPARDDLPTGSLRARFTTSEGMDGQVLVSPPGWRKGVKSYVVSLDRTGGPLDEKGRTKFYPTVDIGKYKTEEAARIAAEKVIAENRAKRQSAHPLESSGWVAETAGPANTIWTKRVGGERYTAILTPAADGKPARMEVTALVDSVDTQIDQFTVDSPEAAARLAEKAIADDAAQTAPPAPTPPAPAKDDANTRARNWAERTAMPDERAANEAANSAAANDPTLDDELNAALGHLGDVLGDVFGAKLNITGPQHSAGDLLPALSKVVELLVRKGFKSFGQAAGKAAQLMRANPKTAAHVDAISPRQWKAAYNAIAEGTEGTDTEEALAALTVDQVKAIVAEPDAAAPTLADKIKAKRAEAAPQPAPEPVAEEAAPQPEPEPAPEVKPARNDALIDLRKQLSVLKALRACLG